MRRLWRSPTLRAVAVLAYSGVGFAVANLVLARELPTTERALARSSAGNTLCRELYASARHLRLPAAAATVTP